MEDKSTIKLPNMSLQELLELKVKVAERLDELADEERKKLAAEFQRKASRIGMTAEEVIRGPKKAKKRAPAKPKFRDPNDPARTWTGRGRQPVWFREALDSGRDSDDLLIRKG